MPLIEVTDVADDPRLEVFTAFTDAQLMRGECLHLWRKAASAGLAPKDAAAHNALHGVFVAESQKVIERALDQSIAPLALLVEHRWMSHEHAIIERVSAEHPSAPIFTCDTPAYQKITGYKVTRGAMAALARPKPRTLDEVVRQAQHLLIVEDVTNFTNLGSMFRTAAALGIDGVLVTPGCHDPLYRRCVRVSMGAALQIPWTHIEGDRQWARATIPRLRQEGFAIAAMALVDNAPSFEDGCLDSFGRIALVLGSEGDGLQQQTISLCDMVVSIPMEHGVDSLNVASAATIALWELRRIRKAQEARADQSEWPARTAWSMREASEDRSAGGVEGIGCAPRQGESQ